MVFSTVVYIYVIHIWGKKTLEWYTRVISIITSRMSGQDCTYDEGSLDSSSMFKLLIKAKALQLVC